MTTEGSQGALEDSKLLPNSNGGGGGGGGGGAGQRRPPRKNAYGSFELKYPDINDDAFIDRKGGDDSSALTAEATIDVRGMTCASCVNTVERALEETPGVISASVALVTEVAKVKFRPASVSPADLVASVEDVGFEGELVEVVSEQNTQGHRNLSLCVLEVRGMTCASCVSTVERALNETPGVKSASVALITEVANVQYAPDKVSPSVLVEEIEDVGFDAKIVKRDIKAAFKYLQQAAKGNDARAITDLASLYDYGTGVKKDRKKAAKLYLRAANMGMPAAMFNVAAMLETGDGIAVDKIEAYKFYLLSRDQGFAPFANKALEEMAANMSVEQIVKAEDLADNFVPGRY